MIIYEQVQRVTKQAVVEEVALLRYYISSITIVIIITITISIIIPIIITITIAITIVIIFFICFQSSS